ncbi:MAG TPA: protein translocase subunit SecF [Rhizomicrobium sp.]|jgi:preprotein translocase subunit SecF|nr:protein translocase subunit SecF [Rhizomicrobium sp.]
MPFLRFIPETTNVNFVGLRYYAFAVDGLLLLIAIVSIVVQGFNLGIDFTGGVMVDVKAPWTVDDTHTAALGSAVRSLNFGDVEIQNFAGGDCDHPANSCAMIRVQPSATLSGQMEANAIKSKLGSTYKVRSVDVVGPKVSQELFRDGVLAMLLAVLAIAGYVAVRFEWQYGVGALFATGHDVLVTAGMYSVFHLDFSLKSVAALLLLAGYSINDTVVVFDRIRENRRKYKRMSLPDLINLSTNHIATRTTLVSVATALSIIPLFIYGGPALFDFSAAILFGILVGTFSSTYVAAALLLYLPPVGGGNRGVVEEKTA